MDHGRCVCPRNKWLACDMDCFTCPFQRAGDERSLDYEDENEEGEKISWINKLPDEAPLIEEILTDASEAKALYDRLCELMPEAIEIGRLRLAGMPDTEIQKHIGIGDSTFQYRIKKIKKALSEEFPEFF